MDRSPVTRRPGVGLLVATVLILTDLAVTARPAAAHGHGGGHGRRSQAVKDANSWRDGFRGPHDFGGGVTIPQDRGLNLGLGGGLDGRGFGAAATPLDGGGRLDGSDWSLDGGATQGYRSGRFAGTIDPPASKPAAKSPARPAGPPPAKTSAQPGPAPK
jgi:hypothetical protein